MARAANAYLNAGLGKPILIGREEPIREAFKLAGIELTGAFERHDTSLDARLDEYAEFLYQRLQRNGYLLSDCSASSRRPQHIFVPCMIAMGHADGIVTGVTRNWYTAYEDVRCVLDAKPGQRPDRRIAAALQGAHGADRG